MERILRVIRLVFRNIYTYRVDYIRVFLGIRLFQLLIALPSISLLLTATLHLLSIDSITEENIIQLFAHPLFLFVIALMILIVLLFIYYEMGLLILLAYHQQRGIPYTLRQLWRRLNKKVVYFISFETGLLFLYVVLVMPLISSILPSTITQSLSIPDFIVDELMTSSQGRLLYIIGIALLFLISLRFILTMPYFTVYQWTTILQAVKLSWQFSQRRLVELVGMLGLILIMHLSLTVILLGLTFVPLFVIERLIPDLALVTAAFTLTFAQGLLLLLFTLLQALFSQLVVVVGFRLTHDKPVALHNESFRETIMHWTIVCTIFVYFLMSGVQVINLEKTLYEPETKVIAHRGFMEQGVENTMSSLIASVEAGADIVEIDIQQTKDGKFVVFHDPTLMRMAGRKEAVYQMALDELTNTTVRAGKLRDKIPSLEEMLQKSEELNIQLLIEIKPHGHETDDYLQQFIELLLYYDALEKHYVQSIDSAVIWRLNELEPRLKVGLVFALYIGKFPPVKADFIALQQDVASGRMIEQVKRNEMELFIWTVNAERDIQYFLEHGVDGIITNHPDKAKNSRTMLSNETYFLKRIYNKLTILF
ncbi:glycerophosphoryl diester phosphodiesterase membrane domain-containing protein [Metasolibacillus fluoroglycofenilyticus]|uniref:glycerophosphoryl diester phosphodiesterase membrane domain-containing protein n=1 Tax=Metasolibacillus fluoroglycofenilyticus TaxID=1239396 RepID=UPI000D355B17|nr:glycerophosphodiester phosphodiesterase [Metasolibacillus fluoroglycofenilyticus]